MPHEIKNGILVDCNDCVVYIEKRIREKKPLKIKKFRDSTEESRKDTLEFIISTLYLNNYYISLKEMKYFLRSLAKARIIKLRSFFYLVEEKCASKLCRETITNLLLKHGQFQQEEIDMIFMEYEYDKGFNFPTYSCDFIMWIDFCKVFVEILNCPDCGYEVTNTPNNVSLNYEENLVCPRCIVKKKDEFETRGLIKVGNPTHHGNWDSQKPEIKYIGTDYFIVLHPHCQKSQRPDGKGEMLVNGIWVDDGGRIVLSLECAFCRARNALKPVKQLDEVPLLNESGAQWKRIESPIREILSSRESQKLEFKSSLRWDIEQKCFNKELEFAVVKTIAGFMNSRGGTLVIGVNDDIEILGIEKDYLTFSKGQQNNDRFERRITELIQKFIGLIPRTAIEVDFWQEEDKEICMIRVNRYFEPIFVKEGKKETFFIRSGNATIKYDEEKTKKYIEKNWFIIPD